MVTATVTKTGPRRSSTAVVDGRDEELSRAATTSSSSTSFSPQRQCFPRHRRRHSSYHLQQFSAESGENLQLMVDQFLTELSRRLDFLEAFGRVDIDQSIERAYSILHQVREACSHVSDEVIGAGRRRAKVFVDTLDERYQHALTRKETLDQKVSEGIRLMDGLLTDFESRAYAMRDSQMAASKEFFDSSLARTKEVMDDSIERARRAKDRMKIKIDSAIRRAQEVGLLHIDELPDPWKINPYIYRGYRFSETKLDCVRSILGFSNETVNIWSHLIGLIMVVTLGIYIYPSSPSFLASTTSDTIIAFIFFLAAGKCLVCSTMWHTMSSISNQPLMERFACVDYTGISLLVATSIMTTEYTAFYCEPVSRWTYMLTTAVLGIAGTILPWHPHFNRSDMAWGRVAFFVGLAATGALPVAQLIMTRGWRWAWYFYSPIGKSLAFYFGGAILYAAKMPERWFPGAFDYFGGSHNIWHLAVLSGILFHYVAMQEFFKHAFARAVGECSVY